MIIVWAFLFGALIGWINSLVVRSDSNERIIIDILVGALGGVSMALALGNSSIFDSLVAAFLGAFVASAVLYLVRRTLASPSN